MKSKTTRTNRVVIKNKTKKRSAPNYKLELQAGGGISDYIYSKIHYKIYGRINNIINKLQLSDTLSNAFSINISEQTQITDKVIRNLKEKLKSNIYNFLVKILKKFYYTLKSNQSLFYDTYKVYNYKKVFKFDNDKLINNKIHVVLINFINNIINVKKPPAIEIYPLSKGSRYNNSVSSIFNYFNSSNNSININTINSYITKIIEYDNIINNKTFYDNHKTYLIPNTNNTNQSTQEPEPELKYKNLLYIVKSTPQLSTPQISKQTVKYNTIYLIIYKNFSKTQCKQTFKYNDNLKSDNFYILENLFTYMISEFKALSKVNDFKKLIDKHNSANLTDKLASEYGEFLYYYYKSYVFDMLITK